MRLFSYVGESFPDRAMEGPPPRVQRFSAWHSTAAFTSLKRRSEAHRKNPVRLLLCYGMRRRLPLQRRGLPLKRRGLPILTREFTQCFRADKLIPRRGIGGKQVLKIINRNLNIARPTSNLTFKGYLAKVNTT